MKKILKLSERGAAIGIMLFLLLASISVVNAATSVSQETIMSDGILGDSVIRATYSDGSTVDVLQRGISNTLKLRMSALSISYIEPGDTLSVSTGVPIEYTVGILGVGLDQLRCHETRLEVYDKSNGNLLQTIDYGCLANQKFFPDLYGKILNLGSINQRGTYGYRLQEMVQLQSPSGALSWVRGDVRYLTAIVGGGAPTPQPTYNYPTPQPTYNNPTPQPTSTYKAPPPKPVIIPPALSALFEKIWLGIKGLLGLTISGSPTVDIQLNKPYSTAINLAFTAPDNDYSDGTYQTVFAEWFIADSNQAVKYESGWQQLSLPPYGTMATFTPLVAGKYYLIGVVVKQDYTWSDATQKWSAVETVETKEVQELNAKSAITPPSTGTGPTTTAKGVLASLWAWIIGLFGW